VIANTKDRDLLIYSAGVTPDFRSISKAVTASQATAMNKTNSSMQLTRAADYAVRVMVYLASLPSHQRVLLHEIAHATAAPESFLSKILQSLARAKLIASRRGHTGGFEILPMGREASMREVIEAIDGPLYLNLCLISKRSCARQTWCPAHPVWVQAQQAMLDVLSRAIVSDLVRQGSAPREAASMASACPSELKMLGR
jgi:Rrf2 family protein